MCAYSRYRLLYSKLDIISMYILFIISQEEEAPPPDKYHGLRVHCWVLVLAGKREVGHSFFIEPTTGDTHPLDWNQYLGIEMLWNHKNYWVNMQDCSHGIQVS